MAYFYFHAAKEEPLSIDTRFAMADLAEAEQAAAAYLLDAARDKMAQDRNCRELVCFVKNKDGEPLTRVAIVLQIEAL